MLMVVVFVGLGMGSSCSGLELNETLITQKHRNNQQQQQQHRHQRFTIDELLSLKFQARISDDIDMDPCKSSQFLGDIALPNVN